MIEKIHTATYGTSEAAQQVESQNIQGVGGHAKC